MEMNVYAVLGIVYIIMGLFFSSFWVVEYVFNGIAISTISKRRGVSSPALAWIPFARIFLFGKIAEQFVLAQYGKSKKYGKILLLLMILFIVGFIIFITALSLFVIKITENELYGMTDFSADFVPVFVFYFISIYVFVGTAVPYSIFNAICTYKIFRSLDPKKSILFLVLHLAVGMVTPFAMFAMRNKDDGFIELNEKYRANQA